MIPTASKSLQFIEEFVYALNYHKGPEMPHHRIHTDLYYSCVCLCMHIYIYIYVCVYDTTTTPRVLYRRSCRIHLNGVDDRNPA